MTAAADQRALGALVGVALGDALGMPTQLASRAQIVARYGPVLDGLHAGPHDHPIAADLPAGSITDDTWQTLLLADLLIAGRGRLDQHAWARALLDWEDRMRAAGSLDLLGPSTRAALDALAAGVPVEETGRAGTTNGAAMRVAPVGIIAPPDPGPLVDLVVEASRLTHGTSVALAGAAAVAGAVSAGVAGADLPDAVELALACAREAAGRGRWVAGADVAARIEWALRATAGLDDAALLETVTHLVGTSLATTESVPAAFAFACARPDDPWLALRLAASAGGDTDTVAAMAGALLGATHGPFAPEAVAQVERVNGIDLARAARGLLALRPTPATAAGRNAAVPVASGPSAAGPGTTAPPVPAPNGAGRLVYVGQGVVDLVTQVPSLPSPGGDVIAGPLRALAGGGVNVMVAAARLGRPVLYAGRHGRGPYGDLVRAALGEHGVRLALPASPGQDTGTVLVLVAPDGERTFVTSPGAEAGLTAADLAQVRPAPGDVVVVSGYTLVHPSNRAAVLAWLPGVPGEVTVLFDPGPLVDQVPPEALRSVLARADWVSANEAEARALTGLHDPAEAARALAERARGHALVRRGAAGCLLAGPSVQEVPSP
ncbi:MAG: ADP-ribosylglycohydrolase family protein, partial [Actinobacteria bacterium]|nr:ADP-ribosylglycohydrolase family protein [Actinomycetota bacterium]